jgi:hypothetical protein
MKEELSKVSTENINNLIMLAPLPPKGEEYACKMSKYCSIHTSYSPLQGVGGQLIKKSRQVQDIICSIVAV